MEAYAHRANARAALRGNWVTAVIVAFLIRVISGSDAAPTIKINFEYNEPVQINVPENMVRLFHDTLGFAMPVLLVVSMVVLVVSMIVSGVLDLGSARYNLNLIDRRGAEIADLFTGIPRFSAALVMHLLRTVLTLVGFLLLLVPGILMTYGFAMAPYILAETEECTGWEALMRSYDMMRGHKLELFWLELTFIGWEILAAFTFGLGSLVLSPYKAAAQASFYRELSREYIG